MAEDNKFTELKSTLIKAKTADAADASKADNKRDGHPDREAGDIDGGVTAVLSEVTDGEQEIIFEHAQLFSCLYDYLGIKLVTG